MTVMFSPATEPALETVDMALAGRLMGQSAVPGGCAGTNLRSAVLSTASAPPMPVPAFSLRRERLESGAIIVISPVGAGECAEALAAALAVPSEGSAAAPPAPPHESSVPPKPPNERSVPLPVVGANMCMGSCEGIADELDGASPKTAPSPDGGRGRRASALATDPACGLTKLTKCGLTERGTNGLMARERIAGLGDVERRPPPSEKLHAELCGRTRSGAGALSVAGLARRTVSASGAAASDSATSVTGSVTEAIASDAAAAAAAVARFAAAASRRGGGFDLEERPLEAGGARFAAAVDIRLTIRLMLRRVSRLAGGGLIAENGEAERRQHLPNGEARGWEGEGARSWSSSASSSKS